LVIQISYTQKWMAATHTELEKVFKLSTISLKRDATYCT
jgi:hypothetical protein